MSTPCYIVTGAGGSIGAAITQELARRGKWVIMACRNLDKDTPLRDKLNAQYPGRVSIMQLDLASLSSVVTFARTIRNNAPDIQALINNAGVMCKNFSLTPDGYETTVGVNFVGTYLLTRLLTPCIRQGGNIVFTTSLTRYIGKVDRHFFDTNPQQYHRFKSYSASKLATTILTAHLAETLAPAHIHVNATDPGVVNSRMIHMDAWFDPLADRFFRPLISTPAQGAAGALAACDTQTTASIFTHHHNNPIPAGIQHHKYRRQLMDETDNRLATYLTAL